MKKTSQTVWVKFYYFTFLNKTEDRTKVAANGRFSSTTNNAVGVLFKFVHIHVNA